MKKRFLLTTAVIVLIFSGCLTGLPDAGGPEADYRKTVPLQELWNLDRYPANVFMGVSAPYANTDRMVSEALYNCARSIAVGQQLQVSSALVSESSSGGGLISFATEGGAKYFENEIADILDRLELLEVRGGSRSGVVVIAADPEVPALPRPFVQKFDDSGRPLWVDTLPEIPGYLAAVGSVLGYRFERDSLEAADVTAAELLLNKSPEAVTEAQSYSVSSSYKSSAGNLESFQEGVLQKSEGALEGFYVLARWYDAAANYYYSLAVIPLR
ncbi:MAG: hypothetical protein K9L21_03490 [Spirochaetia bacterium]|nr:hypothetical protein [Spirochaetia bacterium]